MANVRQRYSFAPDYGVELGLGAAPTSLPANEPAPLRRTAENLLWLAAAVFAIYYGDSRHHLFHVLFYDTRIRRSSIVSSLPILSSYLSRFLYPSLTFHLAKA